MMYGLTNVKNIFYMFRTNDCSLSGYFCTRSVHWLC